MNKIRKNKSILGITLFLLFLLQFYKPIFLPSYLTHNRHFLILLIIVLGFTKQKFFKNRCQLIGIWPFAICFALIIVNCFTCQYFRGQGAFVSLKMWLPFFSLFLYPTFASWDMPTKYWEKILKVLFFILLACYLLQYIFIDVQLFALDTDFDYLSYETRVRLYSDGIITLGGLFYFNKYLLKKKTADLILFLLAALVILLQGFRMILAGFSVSCFILLYRHFHFSLKYFGYMLLALPFLYFAKDIPFVSEKIDEMVSRNETQNFDDDSYIRAVDIAFTYSDYFKNNAEMILGSGMTQIDVKGLYPVVSEYSKYRSELADTDHYYPVDLGLLGLSWEAGIPFTLAYIFLLLRVLWYKVDKRYYYLGLWCFLIVIVGGTSPLAYYDMNCLYVMLVYVIVNRANYDYQKRIDLVKMNPRINEKQRK